MKKTLIISALIIIIILPLSIYIYLRIQISKSSLLKLGEKAPYIELKTVEGREFSLKKNEGKKTLIVFFKTDCLYCLKQLANLNEIKDKINSKLEIIAISESDERKTREFIETYKIDFMILIDDKGIFKNIYRSSSFPSLYLLDEEMRVRYRRSGLMAPEIDEKIISEFEKTNKIPFQIYSDIQKKKFTLDDLKIPISGFMVKDIALNNTEVRRFIEENFRNPEQRVEVVDLRWFSKEQMYKWIIQIIELSCDCQDKKANTLNAIKVEIDPMSGQITNLNMKKGIREDLYKEILYQEVIGNSFLLNKKR